MGGSVLLGTSDGLATAEWLPPWVALSCVVGIDVAVSGLLFPLEGAGQVIAGQLGITWQIAAAISSIAGAIVATRFPEFSRLAGARSIRELDGLLLSTTLISMTVCLFGALGVGLGVLLFQRTGLQIATRVLPFDQVVILLLGVLIWHFNFAIVSYLRAHGGDPFLPASLGGGAVLLFVANFTLGRWFGPVGLLWGYAVTGAGFMVPFGLYLLQRKRETCGYPPFKIEGASTINPVPSLLGRVGVTP